MNYQINCKTWLIIHPIFKLLLTKQIVRGLVYTVNYLIQVKPRNLFYFPDGTKLSFSDFQAINSAIQLRNFASMQSVTTCPAGTTRCGNVCVNLRTDFGNCGYWPEGSALWDKYVQMGKVYATSKQNTDLAVVRKSCGRLRSGLCHGVNLHIIPW